jgi:hypothetical protein
MRDGAVQSDVIAKRVAPLVTALHDNQPAVGPDVDRDLALGAISSQGFDKCSLAVEHYLPVAAAAGIS